MKSISSLIISEDSGADELEPIAAAVHFLTGLPTTIRSLRRKGVRMEKGEVVDFNYSGPVLEEVLRTNTIVHRVPDEGVYKGKPVVVAPIRSKEGEVIAAIGIVDLLSTLDLSDVFLEYPSIIEEVEGSKKRLK